MSNNASGEMVMEIRYQPIPWTVFVAEVQERYYNPKRRAIATWRQMKRCIDLVSALTTAGPDGEPVPMVRTTADLTHGTVSHFFETRPPAWSPQTALGMLRCIRRLSTIAIQSRYLAVSPFAAMPVGSWIRASRPQGKRHLDRREIRAILDVLEKDVETLTGWSQWKARRLQFLVAIVVYCGLRIMEAARLQVDDIDLEARMIHVRPHGDHWLKTWGSEAPVPMPPALVPIVEEWLRHRLDAPRGFKMPSEVPFAVPGCGRKAPWTGGSLGDKPLDRLQDIARRAGVEHATFHALRRSLATHLRHFGVSAGMASKILRHSIAVDEAFYHGADNDNLREAVKDVRF
jgi:integrase